MWPHWEHAICMSVFCSLSIHGHEDTTSSKSETIRTKDDSGLAFLHMKILASNKQILSMKRGNRIHVSKRNCQIKNFGNNNQPTHPCLYNCPECELLPEPASETSCGRKNTDILLSFPQYAWRIFVLWKFSLHRYMRGSAWTCWSTTGKLTSTIQAYVLLALAVSPCQFHHFSASLILGQQHPSRHLATMIILWIDILEGSLVREDCCLYIYMTDSSTSEGWTKKACFSKLHLYPIQATIHMDASRSHTQGLFMSLLNDYSVSWVGEMMLLMLSLEAILFCLWTFHRSIQIL